MQRWRWGALTPRTAIAVAVHDTWHGGERGLRAWDKMRALQALAPAIDDDGVFAFERRVIEGEILGAEVCGVVLGSRRPADKVNEAIHARLA